MCVSFKEHSLFFSFVFENSLHPPSRNAVKNSIQNLNPAVHILHKARYVKTLQRMMIYKSECWSIVTGDTRFNFDWSGTMELSPKLQLSPMFHPLSFPILPYPTPVNSYQPGSEEDLALECWWSFGSHRCKHCRNVFDQSRRTQQLNSSSGLCTPGNLSHALDTSEVNQIRGKMERWSLEEFGWKKNPLFAKCFNQKLFISSEFPKCCINSSICRP